MLKKERDEFGNYVYKVADDSAYYRQTNNDIDPFISCCPTNIIQSFEIRGVKNFPTPKGTEKYKQPEDRLNWFENNSPIVNEFYKSIDFAKWSEWKQGKKNAYNPRELHKVACFSANLFMNSCNGDNWKNYISFSDSVSIEKIISEIVEKEKPIVMSGKFGNLNHVFTLVGLVSTKEIPTKESIKDFLIFDTYGTCTDWSKGTYSKESGRNVKMKYDEFVSYVKPTDSETKFGYLLEI